MRVRFNFRRLGIPVIVSAMVAGVGSAGWAVQPAGETSADAAVPDAAVLDRTPAARGAGARTVTLVTGDRVTLHSGDTTRVSVVPGKGRRHVGFRITKAAGTSYVFPTDMVPLVAAGRLDRRLFDVAGLIRDGYDDRTTRTIPLIVTYHGAGGRAATTRAGGAVTRALPSVDGAAVRITKGRSFADALPVTGSRFAGGVERVWLDGKRRTTLAESVPRIGAPAAWKAGYTGKGVTVAVLDSGIDKTHADLADRVQETKNFTAGPAGDQDGHGTHVASTIAGTAAASAGRYRGVAPDARILDGKVCTDTGCEESAIIAAMEWAATEKKADVVNVSLGGLDMPGIDPVEEAVNTLTARTGSLFVIAAGNEGPGARTLLSPGSADAALTVGAVDKTDAIARFSSRGPRIDGAIKPDVTAPGVDILAARAKDTWLGDPVGEHYAWMSGTSMATPHVAGAVALLAQQHPEWNATELKAALMSSARPHAAQSVFDQGAGRVDVARAVAQTVVSQPGGVTFGQTRWPHHDDAPVARQVTYRNLGKAAVTLRLRGTLTGPDGRPAPAGALRLGSSSITVPASGRAIVTVTSSTKHHGPDGRYEGRVTATGSDGQAVTTPLVHDKEVESYDLTVTHLGTDGKPTADGATFIWGLDRVDLGIATDADGTATVRRPKGRYLLDGGIVVQRSDTASDKHLVVQPILRLERPTTVTIDARRTKQVTTTVQRSGAKAATAYVGATLMAGDVAVGSFLLGAGGDRLFSAPLGEPVAAPDKLTAFVGSDWGIPGADGSFANTPFVYSLVDAQPGRLWHGFSRTVDDRELATVRMRLNVQTPGRQATSAVAGSVPGQLLAIGTVFDHHLPSTITRYLDTGPTTWSGAVDEVLRDQEGNQISLTRLFTAGRSYQAGRSYTERWNAAVFRPSTAGAFYAVRTGDQMIVYVPMYSDQDGNLGESAVDTASSRLYRNGVPVGGSKFDGFIAAGHLPAEDGEYKLVSRASRPGVSDLATRTDVVWTFRSEAGERDQVLPLWAVRYFPAVDSRNTVRRSKVTVLPVQLETPPGAVAGKPRSVRVRVSGDDGKTWTNAAVRRTGNNRYVAVFLTPKGSHVSLMARVADSNRNGVEQTIVRAYALR